MNDPRAKQRRLRYPWRMIVLAVSYCIVGLLSLLLAIPPGVASPIWPSAGIALAGILIFGYSALPGVLLGSFLANMLSIVFHGIAPSRVDLVLSTAIAVGATAQAGAATWLIQTFVGKPDSELLTTHKNVIKFLLFGAVFACVLSATCGVSAMLLLHIITPQDIPYTWFTWWVGDTIGTMVFAPLILVWLYRGARGDSRPAISIVTTLGIAFAVVVAGFIVIRGWERERTRQDFEARTESASLLLRHTIDRYVQVVYALRAFYAASDSVTRDEFGIFSQALLNNHEGIRAVGWDQRVPLAERESFEQQMRREGITSFTIHESVSGQLVSSPVRDVYYPGTYIYPIEGNEAIFGFNVASLPSRSRPMQLAQETGSAAATEGVELVQETEHRMGFLVFLPVYSNKTTVSLPPKDQSVLGFVIGAFRIHEIVGEALKDWNPEGIEFHVHDDTGKPIPELLYSQTETGPHIPGQELTTSTASLTRTIPFQLPGHRWILEFRLPDQYQLAHSHWQAWSFLVGGLLFVAMLSTHLLVITGRTSQIESIVRERTSELHLANEELARHATQLKQRREEMETLGRLTDQLQACQATSEAYAVIGAYVSEMFTGLSGALYAHSDQDSIWLRVAQWGAVDIQAESFEGNQCWAVRTGHLYSVTRPEPALMCGHVLAGLTARYLCVPVIARGHTLAMLHIIEDDNLSCVLNWEAAEQLSRAISEQIGLALSNLNLREQLEVQAENDPLTGLFNRRYMDAALQREIQRASRTGSPVSVLVIDVDHFKQFNDTYGHDKGDEVLRGLADFLKKNIRGGDIACRYGGEEFVVIFPNSNAENAANKAERLRKDLTNDAALHQDSGTITISIGVAAFPEHGQAPDQIFKAADSALYQSKHAGRNRVTRYTPPDAT